jgi:hypothetical protein
VVGLFFFLAARPTLLSICIALPIVFAGEVIRTWASGCIVKNDTLTIAGPYGLTRNPLYLGNFFLGLGFVIMSGVIFLPFVFIPLFFLFTIQQLPGKKSSWRIATEIALRSIKIAFQGFFQESIGLRFQPLFQIAALIGLLEKSTGKKTHGWLS